MFITLSKRKQKQKTHGIRLADYVVDQLFDTRHSVACESSKRGKFMSCIGCIMASLFNQGDKGKRILRLSAAAV